MPMFMVTPLGKNDGSVARAIEAAIDERRRYPVSNTASWFVSFNGTTIELSKLLGVTGLPPGVKPSVGPALVTLVPSYYGRGPTGMWEWLQTRIEDES